MAVSLTYNSPSAALSNIVTFSDIPNILKVTDSGGGTHAVLYILLYNDLKSTVTGDSQYFMTLFGETITNVTVPSNAVNKSFYIGNTPQSTVASVVKAFRNCPTLAANFLVEVSEYGSYAAVKITAREIGSVFSGGFFNTNIPNGGTPDYIYTVGTDGTSNSQLQGALVDVDVYINGDTYVTTLEKSFYDGEVAFDMSPLLTTVSEVGRTVPYSFKVSSLKDGEYSVIGYLNDNYASVGYMCNQGYKYLNVGSSMEIAQNVSRGTTRDAYNNTLLYLYFPRIPLSFYTTTTSAITIQMQYLDSAFNVLTSTTTSYTNSDSSNRLCDVTLNLLSSKFNEAFYIDVTIDGKTIRYNVIKPLKATEGGQRILWRNSYGGVSFFDFTGQKSETRNLELSTYQKNIFGYYDDEKNELNKIYDSKVDYTVTLKSHLFENDGKYIFNDMLQSSEVWTEINGETYGILIDSISVEEQNQNNIYEATVRYKYSQEPSLL